MELGAFSVSLAVKDIQQSKHAMIPAIILYRWLVAKTARSRVPKPCGREQEGHVRYDRRD